MRPTSFSPSRTGVSGTARAAGDLEHPQAAVHLPAVVLARNRLLTGIATLRERDRALVEPRLCGEDAVVDLAAEAGRRRLDAQRLQRVLGAGLELRVEHLHGGHAVVAIRDPIRLAEDDRGGVLLELDLALRGEPHACELPQKDVAELGLGQEEDVVGAAAPDEERRDHARLRGEQERVDRPFVGHVVREHAVQVVDGVGALHPDVRPAPARRLRRNGCHRSLD